MKETANVWTVAPKEPTHDLIHEHNSLAFSMYILNMVAPSLAEQKTGIVSRNLGTNY